MCIMWNYVMMSHLNNPLLTHQTDLGHQGTCWSFWYFLFYLHLCYNNQPHISSSINERAQSFLEKATLFTAANHKKVTRTERAIFLFSLFLFKISTFWTESLWYSKKANFLILSRISKMVLKIPKTEFLKVNKIQQIIAREALNTAYHAALFSAMM